MISRDELKNRLINACEEVSENEPILTDIDTQFGDADHGTTMVSISRAMTAAVTDSDGTIRQMMYAASMAVKDIRGGSIVPLWNAWLDGLSEGAPDTLDASEDDIRTMFAEGLRSIDALSGAKVGDKTMMDALIPASDAIAACTGDVSEIFDMAALAALNGAEYSKLVPAKFGSARAFGEKTIGTPDV
ncbi:MAG: DAK2 domain-containing protein, partial [Eubacteriaceae bacterium]|nr:DAK2 domain-containing protein [Eubacteriaceae bacterium]